MITVGREVAADKTHFYSWRRDEGDGRTALVACKRVRTCEIVNYFATGGAGFSSGRWEGGIWEARASKCTRSGEGQ